MFYGAAVWDPILIISQILSLQCLFYLSLGLWSTVLLVPTQGPLTVIFVFGWQHLHWSGWPGWLAIGANLLNAVVTAFFFAWIVERAKKCVDFAITLYVFHFILCWCYAGFPAGVSWWATNGTCVLVLCFLSEALCLRREMADIPVTSDEMGPERGHMAEALSRAYEELGDRVRVWRTGNGPRHRHLLVPFGVFSKALRRYITGTRR